MKTILKKIKNKLKSRSKASMFNDINTIYAKELGKTENPIIFDVGSNRGQSVLRFNSILNNPFIHCFEPAKSAFNALASHNFKNVKLNQIALSDKHSSEVFYEYDKSTNSSFFQPNYNSDWYKRKRDNTTDGKVVKDQYNVETMTLDKYAKKNQILSIEILKIDTQGFEPNVLTGAEKFLANRQIKFIETEVTFTDAYEKDISFSSIESLLFENYRVVNITPRNMENKTMFADVLFERR
ncbi:FkbM family methyltransferase [Flavobacteriaceae bacterium]|nr:FkbM family methyltransferase [Flavobacteriaceae bacterium]